jgi:hypothetical protein
VNPYDFSAVDEWNRIRCWFSLETAIAIQRCVRKLPVGARLVEVRSIEGRSSVAIAAVMPPQSMLHCGDHFRGAKEHREAGLHVSGVYKSFLKNIVGFGVRPAIRGLRSNTVEAARHFADESVDLLRHDASHDFLSVTDDLQAWYPRLKPRGWLFCDAYEKSWRGVIAVSHLGLAGIGGTRGNQGIVGAPEACRIRRHPE